MRYSVCIIDNDIPAAGPQAQALKIQDSQLLNASNLQLLLEKETWNDIIIKNLTKTLLEQKEPDSTISKWDVFGFTHPSFFINTINDGFFRPDLVVFDWDYAGTAAGTDAESILKEILTRTFSLVFIFSSADQKTEILEILAKPEFQEFKERLDYLDKAVDDVDQTSVLLQKTEQMYSNNFSFRFASVLRKKTVQSTDKILSDMGRASLNDVKNHVVIGEGGKKDFIDFLAERFRTSIAEKDIYELVAQIPEPEAAAAVPDPTLAAKLWAYRLYFQRETGDDLVRRGDIVMVGGSFRLVLSADCDLLYFWKKNLGIINMVALHELNQTNSDLKEWLTLCVKPEKIPGKISNLLGTIGDLSDGPFVLPFVPVGAGTKNFIAIPKELVSTRITLPAGWTQFTAAQKKSDPMKYAYWQNAERLCTISEPFLTPVIQHVFNTMGGNAVPDYPEHMKDILKKVLDDFSNTGVAAPAAEAQAAPKGS